MASKDRVVARGFTVDAATSRDLDDAFFVEKTDSGWNIEITISDVARMVQKDSFLDRYAAERAFTTYYSWGNKPMLPRSLADDKLSLLPGKSRKTVTFYLVLNKELDVIECTIAQSIYKSENRLSHQEVDSILDNEKHPHHNWWRDVFELSQSLLLKRRDKGGLVVYDLLRGILTTEEGEVVRMPQGQFYRAYVIVQEIMILGNYAVTQYMQSLALPVLYRNHTSRVGNVKEDYLRIINEVLVNPPIHLINQLGSEVRHLLGRALYGAINEGHFALSVSMYAHWTSPIRRYADLVNHRVLQAHLKGEPSPYTIEELQRIAEHINEKVVSGRNKVRLDYKNRTINYLANATLQKLEGLPAGQFSYFVKQMVDETFPLTEWRRDAIVNRINSDAVEIEDITHLLFSGVKAEGLWLTIKECALQWLLHHDKSASAVYNLASIQYDLPEYDTIDFRMNVRGPSHMPEFKIIASLEYLGERYSSDEVTATLRKDAERGALLGLIANIVGLPYPEKVEQSMNTLGISNAKGKLLEICAQYRIVFPESTFSESGPPHSKIFTCTVKLVYQGHEYTSEEQKATSKKESEQLAYADLLNRLPQNLVSQIPIEQPNSPSINAISAVNEWCQKRKINLADFSFSHQGEAHLPLFKCTCTLEIGGEKREWIGVGMQKQLAKLEAAKAAWEDLSKL